MPRLQDMIHDQGLIAPKIHTHVYCKPLNFRISSENFSVLFTHFTFLIWKLHLTHNTRYIFHCLQTTKIKKSYRRGLIGSIYFLVELVFTGKLYQNFKMRNKKKISSEYYFVERILELDSNQWHNIACGFDSFKEENQKRQSSIVIESIMFAHKREGRCGRLSVAATNSILPHYFFLSLLFKSPPNFM